MNEAPRIRAVPLSYAGVTFRSTLEADWAHNLDMLSIGWSYEPWAVELGNGIRYLVDFHLPSRNTWLEVKGPHNERLHKTRQFARQLTTDPFDHRSPLVVIGREANRGFLTFHGALPGQRIELTACNNCGHTSFIDADGTWACRVCFRWSKPTSTTPSETILFHRAPRSGRAA